MARQVIDTFDDDSVRKIAATVRRLESQYVDIQRQLAAVVHDTLNPRQLYTGVTVAAEGGTYPESGCQFLVELRKFSYTATAGECGDITAKESPRRKVARTVDGAYIPEGEKVVVARIHGQAGVRWWILTPPSSDRNIVQFSLASLFGVTPGAGLPSLEWDAGNPCGLKWGKVMGDPSEVGLTYLGGDADDVDDPVFRIENAGRWFIEWSWLVRRGGSHSDGLETVTTTTVESHEHEIEDMYRPFTSEEPWTLEGRLRRRAEGASTWTQTTLFHMGLHVRLSTADYFDSGLTLPTYRCTASGTANFEAGDEIHTGAIAVGSTSNVGGRLLGNQCAIMFERLGDAIAEENT